MAIFILTYFSGPKRVACLPWLYPRIRCWIKIWYYRNVDHKAFHKYMKGIIPEWCNAIKKFELNNERDTLCQRFKMPSTVDAESEVNVTKHARWRTLSVGRGWERFKINLKSKMPGPNASLSPPHPQPAKYVQGPLAQSHQDALPPSPCSCGKS